MINANDVPRAYEDYPHRYWTGIKQRISESPLTALGVAAGAGFLAYTLLKSGSRRHQSIAGRAANYIPGSRMRANAGRSIKAAIGSLALSYLNRKARSKLRWR
jgi:hypothetical protein